MDEVDGFLSHYGVKGMRWGRRKDESPAQIKKQQLRVIDKKIDKIDADKIFSGVELQGGGLKKEYKKAVRKNPDFAFNKLSPDEKLKYQKRGANRAKRQIVTAGTLEVVGMLAVGNILLSKARISDKNRKGAQVSVALLAGQVGKMRVDQIRSINAATKLDRLQRKRLEISKS